MKSKKLISVLCAVSMILAALPAASAVEPKAALSKVAGQTVPIQVVEETENGLVSRVINVAIPAGATVEEETAIIHAAALGKNAAVPFSASASDVISSESNLHITHNDVKIGGGILERDYKRIIVDVQIESIGGNTTLWIQFQNKDTGSGSVWNEVDIYHYPWRVIFSSSSFAMKEGQEIAIYAHTRNLNAELSSCVVQGSTT